MEQLLRQSQLYVIAVDEDAILVGLRAMGSVALDYLLQESDAD